MNRYFCYYFVDRFRQ